MSHRSREISRGEMSLAVVACAILVGASAGYLLSGTAIEKQSLVAAAEQTVVGTSCDAAKKQAANRGGPDTGGSSSFKDGTNFKDTCVAAVLKQSQSALVSAVAAAQQLDPRKAESYECVGKQVTVRIKQDGTISETWQPKRGVAPGLCNVNACDAAGKCRAINGLAGLDAKKVGGYLEPNSEAFRNAQGEGYATDIRLTDKNTVDPRTLSDLDRSILAQSLSEDQFAGIYAQNPPQFVDSAGAINDIAGGSSFDEAGFGNIENDVNISIPSGAAFDEAGFASLGASQGGSTFDESGFATADQNVPGSQNTFGGSTAGSETAGGFTPVPGFKTQMQKMQDVFSGKSSLTDAQGPFSPAPWAPGGIKTAEAPNFDTPGGYSPYNPANNPFPAARDPEDLFAGELPNSTPGAAIPSTSMTPVTGPIAEGPGSGAQLPTAGELGFPDSQIPAAPAIPASQSINPLVETVAQPTPIAQEVAQQSPVWQDPFAWEPPALGNAEYNITPDSTGDVAGSPDAIGGIADIAGGGSGQTETFARTEYASAVEESVPTAVWEPQAPTAWGPVTRGLAGTPAPVDSTASGVSAAFDEGGVGSAAAYPGEVVDITQPYSQRRVAYALNENLRDAVTLNPVVESRVAAANSWAGMPSLNGGTIGLSAADLGTRTAVGKLPAQFTMTWAQSTFVAL